VAPIRPKNPNGRASKNLRNQRVDPELKAMQQKLERALARRLARGDSADAADDPELDRLRRLVEIFHEGDERDAEGQSYGDVQHESEPSDDGSSFDDDEDELGDTDEEGTWWPRRNWSDYEPRHLIPVEGGLAVRSQRGEIGSTWWSKRFLTSLESIAVGGRLSRGRNYARRGQVVDLSLGVGSIVSHVQGTRSQPYEVEIAIPVLDDETWGQIVDLLATEAGYAAELLAGEMPTQIEGVFYRAGTALFPERRKDFAISCTCPDVEEPCKHAAAVCYLVAEAFDEDPFLLLALKGRERAHLLADLRSSRTVEGSASPSDPEERVTWPALDFLLEQFWLAGAAMTEVHSEPRLADGPAVVLSQVRAGSIEVRGNDLSALLSPEYESIARAAFRRAY
jgi:uncharacterized Zn finger protein